MSDVVQRANQALGGTTAGPWMYVPGDAGEASVVSEGERSPDPVSIGGKSFHPGFSVAVDLRNGDAEFIAAARQLIPDLITEVERLRGLLVSASDEAKSLRKQLADKPKVRSRGW